MKDRSAQPGTCSCGDQSESGTATNPVGQARAWLAQKHDTRGEALMMTAISTIASVLLPAF
jgi:hypothetical protein